MMAERSRTSACGFRDIGGVSDPYAEQAKIPTRGNLHSTTNNPISGSRQVAETGEMDGKLGQKLVFMVVG